MNILFGYLIGLFILVITFGLILFTELRVRTALIILLLYPIWLSIFLLDAICLFLRCVWKNKKISEGDWIISSFIWHKIEEKLK